MKERLQPTGTCFTDALEVLSDIVKNNPRKAWQACYLVHGIVAPGDGSQTYSHAWVETPKGVYHVALSGTERVAILFTPEDFSRIFKVVDCTRYTARDAYLENSKHGNFGPWEEKYVRLCKNFEKVRHTHSHNRRSSIG